MKLTLIGGGGVRAVLFTKSLTLKAVESGITKLVLHDTDEEQLNIISKLCRIVIQQSGIDLSLEVTTDARKALQDADYIVTTIRVGKEQSRYIDEEIALKRGLLGQETTGAAGFSMALRTIPVLSEYCELAKEVAPNAWIFNFSNPSGLVTQALRSYGYDRVIGICDTPSHTKLRIAEALGVDEKDLETEVFGLNHLSWIRKLVRDGKDVLPELKKDMRFIQSIEEFKMFDDELLQDLPYLPNEYLYYYYHREKSVSNIQQAKMTRGQMIAQNNKEMLNELRNIDIDNNPEKAMQIYLYYTQKREASYMATETNSEAKEMLPVEELKLPESLGYAGVMLDFVESLQTGKQHNIVLSIPNDGSIEGFEDDDVIEVSCIIAKDGAHAVKIGKIPEDMYILMKAVKLFERLTVEAITKRSRKLAVKALSVHPLIQSYSLAKELVDDYLEQYRDLLGEWS
ncbi:family 4 glycosyl hydrolase [Paenibacillus marinisediminis]